MIWPRRGDYSSCKANTGKQSMPDRLKQRVFFLKAPGRSLSSLFFPVFPLPTALPAPQVSTLAAKLTSPLCLEPPFPAPGLTELRSRSSHKVPVLAGPVRSETVADVREHLVERPHVNCPEAAPWQGGLWGLWELILCWLLSRARPIPSVSFSLCETSIWFHL